jgi:hypothetical protein
MSDNRSDTNFAVDSRFACIRETDACPGRFARYHACTELLAHDADRPVVKSSVTETHIDNIVP